MREDEQMVLNYIEARPDEWFARREIARRAVKRAVYDENPHWVDAPLSALVSNRLVDVNDTGLYRVHRKKIFGKDEE